MESNPQLVQIVPPNEVVVVISFELTIGDLRGMMNLCIPYNSIERIGGKLSANSWVSYGRKNASQETIKQIGETICSSPVGVQVRLAQTKIGTGELMSLRVGDIITTQKDVHQPVIVSRRGRAQVPRQARGLQGPQGDLDPKLDRKPGRRPGGIAVLIQSRLARHRS